MDAYERVLGDAMTGDRTLFAREDYVEEAWRIVDPVLESGHAGLRDTNRAPGGRRKSIATWYRRSAGRILRVAG